MNYVSHSSDVATEPPERAGHQNPVPRGAKWERLWPTGDSWSLLNRSFVLVR